MPPQKPEGPKSPQEKVANSAKELIIVLDSILETNNQPAQLVAIGQLQRLSSRLYEEIDYLIDNSEETSVSPDLYDITSEGLEKFMPRALMAEIRKRLQLVVSLGTNCNRDLAQEALQAIGSIGLVLDALKEKRNFIGKR